MTPLTTDLASFVVHFNEGAVHRLSVLSSLGEKAQVERQKWINAFQEHAAYSSHYLWGMERSRSEEEHGECAPIVLKLTLCCIKLNKVVH